jgi:DNA-binding transcriptional LysR family regulator
VTVQQSYGYFPEMAAALHADQIDLAIVPMAQAVPPPGLAFTELLEGRNVVACRAGHPLTRKRPLRASDLGDYPWVAPLPGSALASDLQAILLAIGLSELTVRYAGGNLMSVVTYMSETDALAVLPYSVVFAGRREGRVTALPLTIPQPGRAVGILRRDGPARGTAADRLASFVAAEFGELRHLIKRHESAVVWAR